MQFSQAKVCHAIASAEASAVHKLFKGNDKNILLITYEDKLEQLALNLKFYLPSHKIIIFPALDVLPFEKLSPSPECVAERIKALIGLVEATENGHRVVLITTADATLRKIITPQTLKGQLLKLKVGDKISRDTILHHLVDKGFKRYINACHAGEFSIRGSIIDFVTDSQGHGFRVDFFGDNIESIKTYDAYTQLSVERICEINIAPVSEIALNPQTIETFSSKLRTQFGLKYDFLIENLKEGIYYPGIENLLCLFYQELGTIFNYLSPNWQIVYDFDINNVFEDTYKHFTELHQMREKFLGKANEYDLPLMPLESMYLNLNAWANMARNFESYRFTSFEVREQNYKLGENFNLHSSTQGKYSVDILKEYLANKPANLRCCVACFSEGSLARIQKQLLDQEISVAVVSSFEELLSLSPNQLGITLLQVESGYYDLSNNVHIISEQDVFGERLSRKANKKRAEKNVFTELTSFSEGEAIVHQEHGIGIFEGLVSLEVKGVKRDFVQLRYAGNDKFYLPVENLELLTKYGSSDDVVLDKLGAISWQSRKAKLKNRIKVAAEYLLKIAAERKLAESEVFEMPHGAYEEFCNTFKFVETDDQQNAIEDVINDLHSGRPMDRLICGDVGFGKTEVALRAAFMALASGNHNQVAVLVPTTLLSRQHFATFTERLANFPFNVKQLSKFTPRSEIKLIKKGLEEGSVDLVIGTHSLLAKDVKFKKLALLIIDEEQHFGVAQKEKLKELKTNCNVLTLSATPIPRTLQMSLLGVKDLSVIATPPRERLPIKTHVMPYDQVTIREAILREYSRGGRVFYVTPRISYIDGICDNLAKLMPEIKVRYAHGAMTPSELDNIMNDFYDGKFHVLVSTTIVESGLDIPSANTIIIDRSHMFGLSQLYQIRGRVGRSNQQAFAYLTYPPGMKLGDLSQKKLLILQSLDSLGAGFNIASHDMDLRGYGNILGDEQSGHIKEVGVELYQHMLEETINAMRSDKEAEVVPDEWSPTLNLGISIQIPQDYIPDASLRIAMYRRIASINVSDELEALTVEMVDRFGNFPLEVENLFAIIRLKIKAKALNIEKIELGEKALVITFKDQNPANPSKVLDYVARNPFGVKIGSNSRLLVSITKELESNLAKGIEGILLQL